MFCSNCGTQLPDDFKVCPQCGTPVEGATEKIDEIPTQQPETAYAEPEQPANNVMETAQPKQSNTGNISEEEMTVIRIHDMAKVCSIMWIVIGAFQCLTCVAIVAGVWNIFMGVRNFKSLNEFVLGNRTLFERYNNGLNNIVISALINFFLGGMLTVALSAIEFVIRDQVLKNKHLFGA